MEVRVNAMKAVIVLVSPWLYTVMIHRIFYDLYEITLIHVTD